MIQINDMFRLCSTKAAHWGYTLWHLEEWRPTATAEGRWERITEAMKTDAMDALLERMQCPTDAHQRFREAG